MIKFLSICASLVVVSGCCSAPIIEPPIGLPICDGLIPVTDQIWNDLQLMRETMSNNQLVDGECIDKLTDRITRHDATL